MAIARTNLEVSNAVMVYGEVTVSGARMPRLGADCPGLGGASEPRGGDRELCDVHHNFAQ